MLTNSLLFAELMRYFTRTVALVRMKVTVAERLRRWTQDRKVAGSNPGEDDNLLPLPCPLPSLSRGIELAVLSLAEREKKSLVTRVPVMAVS